MSGWLAISQTKHASSRATATATVVRFLPRGGVEVGPAAMESELGRAEAASIAAGGWLACPRRRSTDRAGWRR